MDTGENVAAEVSPPSLSVEGEEKRRRFIALVPPLPWDKDNATPFCREFWESGDVARVAPSRVGEEVGKEI